MSQEIFDNAWQSELVPLLNGVTYPDGRWFSMSWTDNKIFTGTETRWDSRNMEDDWTYFTELCRESVPDSHLIVVAGEGGMGTDGVIALIDTQSNMARWVLFLDWSNPFDQIEVSEGKIVAKTTLKTTWSIDLQAPERGILSDAANDVAKGEGAGKGGQEKVSGTDNGKIP